MGKDVIVACDFASAEQVFDFLDKFEGRKPFVKIGMELFYAEGPSIIKEIKARGHKIFLDLKLHIDDPVGAVGVHCANGIWGTLAVGLLANPNAPAGLRGLFYTGDFRLLGLQFLGFIAVAAWATVTMTCFFLLLRKIKFLRAEPADDLAGLDGSEHGLPSAYADFMPAVDKYAEFGTGDHIVAVTGSTPVAMGSSVPVWPIFLMPKARLAMATTS